MSFYEDMFGAKLLKACDSGMCRLVRLVVLHV